MSIFFLLTDQEEALSQLLKQEFWMNSQGGLVD